MENLISLPLSCYILFTHSPTFYSRQKTQQLKKRRRNSATQTSGTAAANLPLSLLWRQYFISVRNFSLCRTTSPTTQPFLRRGNPKTVPMYSRGRDFLFCHLCGTMLTVPSTDYALCPLCKTKCNIKDIKGKEISYTISAEDIRRELGIDLIEEQKVQLSKVNKTCEKCGHGEAAFYTRQMRSADEGQTTFYTCTRCGHQFQEN